MKIDNTNIAGNAVIKIEQSVIEQFAEKVLRVTGRKVRFREMTSFRDRVETAIAHRQPRIIQMGFCDFQTISGRAELIEISF